MTKAEHENSWADLLADGRLPRFALICLGVWLNAADSLVTSTIMPSVGAQLGGYAYFSWATASVSCGPRILRFSRIWSVGLRILTTQALPYSRRSSSQIDKERLV